MNSSLSEYYKEDGEPIKCVWCCTKKIEQIVRSEINGVAAEIEYVCDHCETAIAYWAYGSFDPSYPK